MLFENEYRDRLNIVREMVGSRLGEVQDGTRDMLTSTQAFLYDLLDIVAPTCMTWSNPTQKVTVSTIAIDYDGYSLAPVSWIAVNINRPETKDYSFIRPVPNKNIEHSSSYDAIYEGLTSLFGIVNNPNMPVEVHCDNQFVARQLNNEIGIRDKALLNKQESILSLIKELPVKVTIKWQPAVSTKIMKKLRNALWEIRNNYIDSQEEQ